MRADFNWFKWYTPRVRVASHFIFWLLIAGMYYVTYRRMGGEYVWFFILKDLIVTGSMFYSISWIISKWVSRGKIMPLIVFMVTAYIWWVLCTYLTCIAVQDFIPKSDNRFDIYLGFFLDNSFLNLFKLDNLGTLLLDFLFMVSIPLAPKFAMALRESNIKMIKLERDNLLMELAFLKSQVSPHFLFNTQNIIYRMAEKNNPETPKTILKLSNMLRYIVYQGKDDTIALSKEIAFINDYIDLAKLRYGNNIPITAEIAVVKEPYEIVPLLLIPVIENAFKHGPDRSRNDAWIEIVLDVHDDRLTLTVKNSVNHTAEKNSVGGVGLQNVRRRLELHYPKRHGLDITETDNSYSVRMNILLI